MRPLLALDLPLGPELFRAVQECVERGEAFCVLDQRLSTRRRDDELHHLGATAIVTSDGVVERPEGRAVDEEVALVMLTSGSSGPPKAVELTEGALIASATMTQAVLRGDGPPVWFPCLPANHVGGLAVLLRALFSDATLCWPVDDDLGHGPSRGATHTAVVRTQLARYDLSGYYRVLLGGARPPGAVPDNVVTTWGMTETGSGVVYDGRPLPGVEVAAVDGELCLRSPTLFRGYREGPRPTRVGPDGRDDWFPTGDGGEFSDGTVRVRGRLASVINTGGEKVWPEDLEAILASVPGVLEVAVTGVDDDEWGQRVVALVVGDGTNLDAALRATAEERVGPWAKPKEIRYVAALPRTNNGKVRRGDLTHLH